MPKHQLKINLGQALLKIGSLSENQLSVAETASKKSGQRIKDTLLSLGYIKERDLAEIFSKKLNLPSLSLRGLMIRPELKSLIPSDLARRCSAIPLFTSGNVLAVVTDDPLDFDSLTELAEYSGRDICTGFTSKSELTSALEKYSLDEAVPF